MFQINQRQTKLSATFTILELIFHVSVRNVRKTHSNAFMAIFMNILQTLILVLTFYFMLSILGMRSYAIRGDFVIYIMTGIFLYMTHVKAMGAVAGSEGPASPMMQHAPMTTFISICGAALSALYIQLLSVFAILFVYDVAFTSFVIYDPIGCLAMILLSWFTGCAFGLVLLAIKPWFPTPVSIFSTIYQRANMIASGKMFVANTLPSSRIALFSWNPLFHTIDQARGYAFKDYNPHHSNWEYPLLLGIVFLMLGLMGEFYTRKHASASWAARR
jgi:ABC-type polysaccharide/polyol phosphate export permease